MTGTVLELHRLSCPADFADEDFQTFMKDEIFPSVHRGPTRVGQVVGLSLWRDHQTNEFVWAIEYDGLIEGAHSAGGDGLAKLKSRGVQIASSRCDRLSVGE